MIARGQNMIGSRIGLQSSAYGFDAETDLHGRIQSAHVGEPIACVLVDKAQFLTAQQVWQLARVADELGIPVLCYGLRTDFRGQLVEGSADLLGIADALVELKAVCHCGRKATMNLRMDKLGNPVIEGAQTEIGGDERYVALCGGTSVMQCEAAQASQCWFMAPSPAICYLHIKR